jgi:hypothetical protein
MTAPLLERKHVTLTLDTPIRSAVGRRPPLQRTRRASCLKVLFYRRMSRTTGTMLQVAASQKRPPGGRRVSEAEVERRLGCVERLLAAGVSRADIVAQVGLPARTTDSYVARVRRAWQQHAAQDREAARASALGRLMALREQMLDARAWSPLVRVEQLICELQGLRGGPVETAAKNESAPQPTPPALCANALRERAPLLIQACGRVAAESEDNQLRQQVRAALAGSLALLHDPR